MGPAQAFFLATMRNTQKLRENALFLSRVREDASQAPERGFGRAGSATGVRDGPGEARQAPYHLLPLSGEADPPPDKVVPSCRQKTGVIKGVMLPYNKRMVG